MRHMMKARKRDTRGRQARLGIQQIESLEPRSLLTGISFVPATLTVLIEGSGGPDAAEVRLDPRSSSTTFDDRLEVSLRHDGIVEVTSYAAYQLRQTPQGTFQLTPVQVQFEGLGGNDSFANRTSFRSTARGGSGNDTMFGGAGVDVLLGGAGDDRLYGEGGNDELYGDDGNDWVSGGAGVDWVRGNVGNDQLYGDDGNDRLLGDAGDDVLTGGTGDDGLEGGVGADVLLGGIGVDVLLGGAGDDRLYGEGGNDELYGDDGNDWVSGGAGVDWVRGNAGNDQLYGDDGNDRLLGDDGDDVLTGGAGDDGLEGGAGYDTMSGGAGNDTLRGEAGADTLTDTTGTNVLDGGTGNDIINGVNEIQAALDRKGLTTADTSALSAAVVAAIRGPEARFLRFEGHEFHVKPVERSFDSRGVTYSGRISHVIANAPDDQIDYRVRVENGQIVSVEWEIDDGGFSALVRPAFSIAVSVAGVNIPYVQRVVAENVAEQVVARIENYAYGPWQNAARFMVEDIAAALRDQASTDIALNRVGGTTAHIGALQRLVTGATVGPRAEFQNVFGHEFHAGPMTQITVAPGTVRYSGQLSHHLSFLPDDQVVYSFEVTNGRAQNLTFRINQGGVTALVGPAIKIVDAVVGVPLVGLVTFAAEELVGRIQTVADGSWESVARLIVQEIAATRARM